jgi:hypothetical protein
MVDNDETNILDNIEKLQNTEQQLITRLNTLTSQSGGTISDEVTTLIQQINNISDTRIALFQTLSERASILQSGVANSREDLVAQMTLLNVVEDQLSQAKTKLSSLQGKNDTKLRLVQINTYYGQRYEAQSELMKLVILVCIPILILFILKKKGMLPETIGKYAIGITIAVGGIFVIRKAWDISMRNNMNFDEYDWKYEDPSDHTPSIWEYNKKNLFNFDNPIKTVIGNLGLCVGADCCSNGLYFDEDKQKCSTREHFSGKLVGTTVADFEENKQAGDVLPFTDGMNYASL